MTTQFLMRMRQLFLKIRYLPDIQEGLYEVGLFEFVLTFNMYILYKQFNSSLSNRLFN